MLNGADLSFANLSFADLSFAYPRDANLSHANLSHANLSPSKLSGANLSGANLSGANLSGVILADVSLSDADLSGANLSGANLSGADLSWAILNWKDSFRITDYVPAFLGSKGLSNISLVFGDLPTIVELRKKFKEAGFKNEERSLTSALRKHQLHEAHFIYSMFEKYLIGGMLTDFGANPGGALIPLFVLIFVFVWFYVLAILKPRQEAGIWRIRPENRLIKDASEPDRELVTWATFSRSLLTALYFSILSAFYFGWRELNVSNWLVRIQKKEYTLQATGWVRMVSGIQSLISLYLVALFLLTYFGSPFE